MLLIRRRSTRGMVLIELVGVIAVMTVVLAAATALFATVFRLDRSLGATAALELELKRLAVYFRHDAHRAEEFEINADGTAWTFRLEDGARVEYRVLPSSVERVAWTRPNGEDAGRKRQELSVPVVQIEEVRIVGRPMARLTIAIRGERNQPSSVPMVIEAERGRFSRRPVLAAERESVP